MRYLAVLLPLLLTLSPVIAGAVTMRGKGSGFCPTLLNDQAAANAGSDLFSIQYDETWVLGFVSALSVNGDVDVLGQTDATA